MGSRIVVQAGEDVLAEADTVLLVPHDAPTYPDRMTGMLCGSLAQSKHTYHALSQIALYDYEDRILPVEEVARGVPLTVRKDEGEHVLENGLVILRSQGGAVRVLAHSGLDPRRLLVFANRHCTRWIRLDL